MARCVSQTLAVTALLLGLAGSALAEAPGEQAQLSLDEQEGRARFASGRAAFDAGRYADALDDFRRAHRLTKEPVLLYNIGIAADRLREDAAALEAFEGYLLALPEAENRAEVEARVHVLREHLASARASEAGASPRTAASATAQPAERGATSNRAAWLTVGAGALVTASGAVLLGSGVHDKKRVEGAVYDSQWSSVESAHDRAPRRLAIGSALIGLGVASAVTGLVLRRRDSTLTPSLQFAERRLQLGLAGKF